MKRIEIRYRERIVNINAESISAIKGNISRTQNAVEIYYPGCEKYGDFISYGIRELLAFIDDPTKSVLIIEQPQFT